MCRRPKSRSQLSQAKHILHTPRVNIAALHANSFLPKLTAPPSRLTRIPLSNVPILATLAVYALRVNTWSFEIGHGKLNSALQSKKLVAVVFCAVQYNACEASRKQV